MAGQRTAGRRAQRWLLRLAGLAAVTAGVGLVGKALTPRPNRVLQVNGRRIALTETGEGPTILMLHGLGGQAGNFSRLTPYLDGFRVLIPDRPGAGWSDSAGPGMTGLEGHAATAAGTLRARQSGPALVVGHSLGGAIALRLALDHPDLVAGVVALGALTGPDLPDLARKSAALMAALGQQPVLSGAFTHLLTAPLAAILGPAFLHTSFAPEPVPKGFMRSGGLFAPLSPQMVGGVIRDLAGVAHDTAKLRRDLPNLSQPVALLHGLEDRVLSPKNHAVAAAALIPDADLLLTQGGHMLPATQPALVAAVIRETAQRANLI